METEMSCSPMRRWHLVRRPRLSWLRLRDPIALVTILALCFLPSLVQALVNTATFKANRTDIQPAKLSRLSETVSVHAAGGGNPTIHLSDGHDLLTSYLGPDELRVALEQNLAQPLSLASDDFNEDGVPDLISGYAYNGRGIITLLHGNVDSIYPNAPEAQERRARDEFTDAPFLSPTSAFAFPVAPDFIGTGDFDAD